MQTFPFRIRHNPHSIVFMNRVFAFFTLCLWPLSLQAQTPPMQAELGIVAVVNDEVITSLDVADRLALVMATTNLPNSPEAINRVIPQVTRQLVDEKLQLQDARRLGVNITSTQVTQAIASLATSRGSTLEALYADLDSKGIAKQAFQDQIKAQLAWREVVGKQVRSKVKVTDEEVERARLSKSLKLSAEGAVEVEIVSVVLPVPSPAEEAQVKQLAETLVKNARSGGNFEAAVKQFAPGSSPTPNWVALADLPPALASTLAKAVPGSISNPSRNPDGYVIIKLLNRRTLASAEVNDSQLLIKDILMVLNDQDGAADAELSLVIAKEIMRNPGTCTEETVAGVGGLEDLNIEIQFLQASFSELSQAIKKMVANLSVGAVSEPFAGPRGLHVMMLCERADLPPELAEAEAVYTELMNQKFELESQKYMRDLRRDAFIEFRQ